MAVLVGKQAPQFVAKAVQGETVIDALQHFEENGEVCPMDWQKGEEAMNATHEGVSNYLGKK